MQLPKQQQLAQPTCVRADKLVNLHMTEIPARLQGTPIGPKHDEQGLDVVGVVGVKDVHDGVGVHHLPR